MGSQGYHVEGLIMATSTPEFQTAEDVSDAIGEVNVELAAAQDAVEEGEYDSAVTTLRLQIDELTSILGWCQTQLAGTETDNG